MGVHTGKELLLCTFLVLAASLVSSAGVEAEEPKETSKAKKEIVMVEDGRKVGMEYTLTLDDGTQIDSNVGGAPLYFQQGSHEILPALEEALVGLKAGDDKQVTLPPEQGYGPVQEAGFQEVATDLIPEDARTVGSMLVADDGAGNRRQIRVHELKGDKTVVDLNHPLAGKSLNFAVRILSVE